MCVGMVPGARARKQRPRAPARLAMGARGVVQVHGDDRGSGRLDRGDDASMRARVYVRVWYHSG